MIYAPCTFFDFSGRGKKKHKRKFPFRNKKKHIIWFMQKIYIQLSLSFENKNDNEDKKTLGRNKRQMMKKCDGYCNWMRQSVTVGDFPSFRFEKSKSFQQRDLYDHPEWLYEEYKSFRHLYFRTRQKIFIKGYFK